MMGHMYDLVVRNGTLVDGTGAPPQPDTSVAISGNVIVAIGPDADIGPGTREIDASGLLITPGFVDIHTHYDGQATWDAELEPSTPHGVTTVVMGNCGVGFAPAKPDEHDFLIELMEGVEDIPGAALSEGMSWNWESFPDYLDELDRREYVADIAAMIAHGPVRTYVMGKRGADNEAATSDDIAQMAQIVQEAVEAGAMGFSTSRTITHRAMNGDPVPGTYAAEDELFALGRALTRAGKGVFEVAPAGVAGEDLVAPKVEIDWICRLADDIGRPVTWLMLQNMMAPDEWRDLMDLSQQAQDAGHQVIPQVAGRPFGVLIGLSTRHRFTDCPSFAPLLDLTIEERAAAMADPELKSPSHRRVGSPCIDSIKRRGAAGRYIRGRCLRERQYVLGDPVDYEPTPDGLDRGARGRGPGRGPHRRVLRPALRPGRSRPADGPVPRLCPRQRRRALRDADPSGLGAGPGRWRCPRQLHLRRLDPDVDADPLGPGPGQRPSPAARVRHREDDRRHRSAVRPRPIVGVARAVGQASRRQRHRPRRASASREPRQGCQDLPAGGTRLLQAAEGYVRHAGRAAR